MGKAKPLTKVVGALLILFQGALKYNLAADALTEDLSRLGGKEELAKLVGSLWQKNFLALNTQAAMDVIKINQLVDLQYRFGVTASSDALQEVGKSFLQLKLTLSKADSSETESHLVELSV